MELKSKEKFDWANITDDFKKMQQISGIIAASGILLSLVTLFTSKIEKDNFVNIWYTLGLVGLFTIIYYAFPKLYLNKKLQFLPDLVFVMGIVSMMLNMSEHAQFFFIFLLLILSVNAFLMTNGYFLLSVTTIFLALVFVHAVQGHITFQHFSKEVLFELYGVLAFGIVLRLFATETVSLRKKQEELTKKAKLLFEQKKEVYNLINNISDGLIAVDIEGKITFLNESSLRTLGIIGKTEKLIGKNLEDVFPLSSSDGKISLAEEVMKVKKPVMRDDLRFVKSDKTIRLHINSAPVFDEQKKIVGAIILFRDITAKAQLEEQKAEFNAIASHELRTPLTVIEGFLFYLLNDKKLKYDKRTKEYLEKTYESAQGLLHLSNDILTVIKSEENKIELALEKIEVEKIVKTVKNEFEAKAKAKKLSFEVKIPKNLSPITSDKQKIKEVLINLVENAIKFTEKGGIVVEVRQIDNKETILLVTDTGLGISEEEQKMIFHKFYRAEDWQTRKTGGTGLGLYIAKTFVNRLGGNIGIESKKGAGSTFWFSIPHNFKTIKRKSVGEKKLDEFIHSI